MEAERREQEMWKCYSVGFEDGLRIQELNNAENAKKVTK